MNIFPEQDKLDREIKAHTIANIITFVFCLISIAALVLFLAWVSTITNVITFVFCLIFISVLVMFLALAALTALT